ncbi:MAG: VUT family protein, partial [Rhodospirillaceae bacterium]|nr:VUT family protein [Rhodospirillaceae bacterium]
MLNLKGLITLVMAMALVVAISNVAVSYPINDWLTWGAFTYPIAFLVTDITNRL